MLLENILKPIMVRGINKVDSFASSDQVDIVRGVLVNNLSEFNTFQPFPNRICSFKWIPRRPYSMLVGGKHGELCVIPDVNRYTLSGNDPEHLDLISKGIGPGGEIREIVVDKLENKRFYSLNVSGELVKVDIISKDITVIQPQGNFDVWFGGLNVHFGRKVIFMGDNKGCVHLQPDTTYASQFKRTKVQCHKPGKINHIELHPRDDNILVTAATADSCVRIWDIRKLKDFEPIIAFEHNKGVNSCYFNRSGHKMITTDQGRELRIYSSGDWSHIATISHPHRHYQYITPIRAEWHPLADLIVVGRYPENNKEPKTIDFFDGRDGSPVHSLDITRLCSLNRFNYTGDILASMFQTSITIWRQKLLNDNKSYLKPGAKENKRKGLPDKPEEVSESDSDSENDDDDDDDDDDEDYHAVSSAKKRATTSSIKKPFKGKITRVAKKECEKKKKSQAKRKIPERKPKKKG